MKNENGLEKKRESAKTTRIAAVAIIVENDGAPGDVNRLLSEYSQYVVGRLGIPYRKRGSNVIVVVVDAPTDVVSALTGRLGLLPGVGAKTVYSKKEYPVEGDD